jgi:hypothetical protein
MDANLLAAYRVARADGTYPVNALRTARAAMARGERADAFTWKTDRRTGLDSTEVALPGGYVARVRVRYDEEADLSYLGTFTNERTPGAIRHEAGCRDTYDWWAPAYTEAERYTDLRAMHYGRAEARHMARAQVRDDYKRHTSHGSSWSMVAVTVDIVKSGVALAHGAVYGIEDDSGRTFFEEVARDIISEQLDEARKEAARLVKELTA